ncbi:hypothetical protein [Bordetella genomosp. 1]|uniref:hypothetical protein n=1 Tax=Bordetella genomosp. 1 TaxID=1395607 RepID=UPI0011787C98|nr:hypothetical protein [Bordetella genomosp. 1]
MNVGSGSGAMCAPSLQIECRRPCLRAHAADIIDALSANLRRCTSAAARRADIPSSILFSSILNGSPT